MIIYLVCATVSSIYQIGSISEERRHLLSMTIFVEILFQLPMVIPWVVCLVLYYFAVTRQTKRYITAFIIAMVLLGIGVSLVLCFYSLEYWWFSEISMWGLEDTIGVLNCISVVLYLSLTIIFSVYAGQLLKRIKKIK
jgi:hypothetical protein